MSLTTSTSIEAIAAAPSSDSQQGGSNYVLTISCPQRRGIVSAVANFLYERGFDIIEHQQFDDRVGQRVYLRTEFAVDDSNSPETLMTDFQEVAQVFDMTFTFHGSRKPRILVMVSKFGHCLNDLLFRWRGGTLGGEIALVVSNHDDLRPMVEAAGLTFVHVPVSPESKADAEAELLRLVEQHDVDLVVLARYMQILSNELCAALNGRAINIHHSFLPGFKGARPYHQAHARGVKLVGATAHYVTPDLDEGPIIEQEVNRVDHAHTPHDLSIVGRDAECLALSRAVRWHCQHRVMLTGSSTIVFR